MKEDDYRIKKVGDDWMFIPKKERDEKREYENLTIRIKRREKKILSDIDKIKELKKELKEWKKKRTVGYNTMIKYHKKFLPNFSILSNFGEKLVEYKSGNYAETSGNNQWEMMVSIGGKRKYIYLGTVPSVSYYLDLLENNIPHYNPENVNRDYGTYELMRPHQNDKDKEIIQSKLESYVCDVIRKKMIGILKKDGNLKRFFDKKYKIKGTEILYNLYKKSPHFKPMEDKRKRKKGERLKPIKVGKWF